MQRAPSCAHCFKPYAFKGSGRPTGPHIPRILTCGHTFCDGCINSIFSELHPTQLQCPTCERKTSLPGGKKQIKQLSTNLYVLGILINNVRAALEKDVTKRGLSDWDLQSVFNLTPNKATQSNIDSREAVCEECCTNQASCECTKCEAIFCKSCFTKIHSSRTLRSHEASPSSKRRQSFVNDDICSSHDGKQLEFYDKTDEKLLCSLCVISPQYQGHNIVAITEVCESIKEKIEAELEEVKKVHSKLQQSQSKLSRFLPQVKTECGETIQQIKEHFQELHTRLQAREMQLIEEVKTAYYNDIIVDIATEMVQQHKELETVIEQSMLALSSPSVVVKKGEELLFKLTASKDTPCILSRSLSWQDIIHVSYSDEYRHALEKYGDVLAKAGGLKLKVLSEETKEELDDPSGPTVEMEDVQLEAPSASPGRAPVSLSPRQNLVYVTHIKNPCTFMVQHAADEERLENLMDAINHHCLGAKTLNDVVRSTEIGEMICAQYSVDHHWYRARVIGQQHRPSSPKGHIQPLPQVEVSFIDYGNTEIVPLNRLRKIRPEFTDIPELATNCSLVDVVPPLQNEVWPSQSIKAFGSLTREKALLMSVMRRSGGKLYVDLRSPDKEPTQDDDKPASVRDALVFLGVARFKSPASVANAKAFCPVRAYKEPVIPAKGEIVEVVVTYAENPGEVFVMKETGKEYADVMKVMNQMASMYSTKKSNQWKVIWPYKGLICAARFSGDKVWYRAFITDVIADQQVQVIYVDFGNSEELPFSEIRRIPDHMVQLPKQAIHCSLASIKPIDPEIGWCDECNAFLSDICTLNRYRMKVAEDNAGQPLSVVLYELNTNGQGTSLNNLLLVNNHAAVTNPDELDCLRYDDAKEIEDTLSVIETSETQKNSSSSISQEDVNETTGNIPTKQALFSQKLMYKAVEFPACAKFELAVTYVDEHCTVFGYQTENGDKSLPELMKHVQDICSSDSSMSVSQNELSFNQPCCAKFSEDNLWYRAEVVDFPSTSTVLVDYVDFGNKEEVSLANIKLTAAFLEIPKQCLPVYVKGMPCALEKKADVSIYLSHLLVGQLCIAKVEKRSLKEGVVKCEKLTLADDRNVVELVKEKLLNSDLETTSEHASSEVPKISKKSGLLRSLMSDTYLPEEGVAFDVTVTQVDTPNTMFLQRIPPTKDDPGYADEYDPTVHIANDHLQQLEDISDKMNFPKYFEGKPDIKNVWEKMLCCARYTQDNLWYRAEVISVESTVPLKVNVFYFDYGNSEVVGIDQLKPFPSELLTLPKQAFRCSVAGCQGSASDDINSDSIMQAVNIVIKSVAGKRLICRVLNYNSPFLVELFERVFNGDSYEDIPLHQRLPSQEAMIHSEIVEDSLGQEQDNEENAISKTDNEQEKVLSPSHDEDPEEEFVFHKSFTDGERNEHKVDVTSNEEVDEKPRADVQAPKLLTPAQFFLEKNVEVEALNNSAPDEVNDACEEC